MSLWVSLLGVNEAWEENWVANEEDWRVVTDDVPNAIVRVEFDCETAWVTSGVRGTAFSTYQK